VKTCAFDVQATGGCGHIPFGLFESLQDAVAFGGLTDLLKR
jgi:hypothetical protein